MQKITAAEFKTKVFDYTSKSARHSGKPIIIDFYADWCGPCKRLSPILEEIAKEQPDIEIYKVDVDTEMEIAAAFGISSIPSLLFVPNLELPQMAVGFMNKEAIEKVILQVLKP